jgi:hypothetical protein
MICYVCGKAPTAPKRVRCAKCANKRQVSAIAEIKPWTPHAPTKIQTFFEKRFTGNRKRRSSK